METQSGNGAPVLRGASTVRLTSPSSPSGPRAHAAGNEVLRDDLQASQKIEKFDIPLESLKKVFEKPKVHKRGTRADRGASVNAQRRAPAGKFSAAPIDLSDHRSPGERMISMQNRDHAAGSVGGPRTGLPEEAESQTNGPETEELEPVPLKERVAMYQAAVSKTEGAGSSSAAMDEGEACSLPGGLASVKRQFESQDVSSSQSTVTQFYFKNRSVQDTSDVTARSSARELFPSSQQVTFFQDEKVSHDHSVHQSSVASSYENHYDEMVRLSGDEDSPTISTQALKEQFERSIEEATPTKQIKVHEDT
ncbi:hypothetical protein MATL_G00147190 [Megalops atlanticus]|uniref:Uncharacterized protein n=1 Tax=Megalops atlanticus TaxID=7932 RepID=A0A9D3PRH5_MEGAT|nr:hypothetical protein MATL_G00147190 [Megalops atlanticus]